MNKNNFNKEKPIQQKGLLRGTLWALFEKLLVFSFVFSLILVFAQVVMRYLFNFSLSWSEELARYVFVWQSWLGFSYLLKENGHIRVILVRDFLSPRLKIVFDIVAWSFSLAMVVFLTVDGFRFLGLLIDRGQISPALRIPIGYAYAAVPFSCLLGSLIIIVIIIQNFSSLFGMSREEQG